MKVTENSPHLVHALRQMPGCWLSGYPSSISCRARRTAVGTPCDLLALESVSRVPARRARSSRLTGPRLMGIARVDKVSAEEKKIDFSRGSEPLRGL